MMKKNKNLIIILFSFIVLSNIGCAIYPKDLLDGKQVRNIKKDFRDVNNLKPYSRGFEIKKSYTTKKEIGGLYYVERRQVSKQKKAVAPIIILKNEYLINTGVIDSLKLDTFLIKLKKIGYNNNEINAIQKIFIKGITFQPLWIQHHRL